MKTVVIGDIIEVMETLAPGSLAEKWDNVGLQVGRRDWPVKTLWVALDPTPGVAAAACDANVDLLITHHPLLFRPLRSIDFSTPTGDIIRRAARRQLGVYAAHTNLDSAAGGVNDVLADRIGLTHVRPLENAASPEHAGQGIGRVGALETPGSLLDLAKRIQAELGLNTVRIVGDPDLPVREAAVCSGSGGGLMARFFASGAQVYISGDLGYHDARAAMDEGRGLIDIGHFASEHLVVDVLARRLRDVFARDGADVRVTACRLEKDPFQTI
ncbi:MAG: Nif3-like dinuclear metal center hexameric protein [Desulfobacterales bacterium]|nr:Nif3-like dinuclear metal center hexameric protein [Desulfobacterales bacterium]